MPMTLLIREVKTRIMRTTRERLKEHRKEEREGIFLWLLREPVSVEGEITKLTTV